VVTGGAGLVRAAEWRRVRDFAVGIRARAEPTLLTIAGAAGAGKSTLWRAGIAAAQDAGCRVLRSEPSASEVEAPFVGLSDLLSHLGVSLRPAFRGRGLGTDVVLALCRYGFTVRGLHRLQVDTLASNTAMIRAAAQAGFVPEGRLRQAAWVGGGFADEVILGLLVADWKGGQSGPPEDSEIPGS
jgi:GNAT superfamily N-acetyltransferase